MNVLLSYTNIKAHLNSNNTIIRLKPALVYFISISFLLDKCYLLPWIILVFCLFLYCSSLWTNKYQINVTRLSISEVCTILGLLTVL